MPSPKGTGAPLQPISIVGPARYGLNKQTASNLLGPEWATEALNCVFDEAGRVASRKGVSALTSSAISGTPALSVIFEYLREAGTSTILTAGNSKIYSGTSAPSDITGTATITAGNNWQFMNFNDVVIGVQQGEQPIVYTGTGSFADLTASAGTAPQGNCGVAAFGRVWIAGSDRQTIKYTTLLSYTDWGGAGSGSIDMSSVWPAGMDEIVAIVAYNAHLVVFGKHTIVFWSDGVGSSIGLNPTNMYVTDTIVGVGCIARDSVQQTDNGDLLFLSDSGIQSIQRLIQERSNPFNNVSTNVRDYLMSFMATDTGDTVKSVYNPKEGFYLLILPTSNKAFCFDTRGRLPDGTYRVTEWNTYINAACYIAARDMYIVNNAGGRLFKYSGYYDATDAGAITATYDWRYTSGWLDLGAEAAEYLKILKSITGVIYVASAGNGIGVTWDFDFKGTPNTTSILFSPDTLGEWGIGEWGILEWSGGLALRKISIPTNGTGQYIQIGINATISGTQLALQQINLYAKIGRLAN